MAKLLSSLASPHFRHLLHVATFYFYWRCQLFFLFFYCFVFIFCYFGYFACFGYSYKEEKTKKQNTTTPANACSTGHSLATTLRYACIPVALGDTNCFIHMQRTHSPSRQPSGGIGQQQRHALAKD